jgi:hypothetical protein
MARTLGGVVFTTYGTNALRTNGRYWGQVEPGGPEYDIQNVSAPGVDGTSQMHYGFRAEPRDYNLYYVASTYDGCHTLYVSDLNTWADTNLTIEGAANYYYETSSIIRNAKKDILTYWMKVAVRFVKRA